MTASVLRNVRLFTGGADLTGQNNKLDLSVEAEEKETTTYGDYDPATDSVWKTVVAGLSQSKWSAEGNWAAGDPGQVDDVSWTDLGGLTGWSACPHTAAVGSLAYLTKALRGQYALGDQVGEVAPWKAEASSSWPTLRGLILHDPGTARTTTGNGTAVEHVAVASGQYLYAALHVLSISGTSTPTITVTVESDVDNTFASPATQISFAAADVVGGQILRTAGPITDTWYRVAFTITGSGPSFLFVCSLGVGPG